jgi:3-oxoacyl-[acyl-carrier-protein] synthase II
MTKPDRVIAITGMGSISPLGSCLDEVWRSYEQRESLIRLKAFNGEFVPVANLPDRAERIIEFIRSQNPVYKDLDRTVIMSIYAAREAVRNAGWKRSDGQLCVGVNIGSSRGATELLEKRHAEYLAEPSKRLFPLVSPTTTLGNISSSVAHDVEIDGPVLSHSVTCSTALYAVFNAIAWMRAGMVNKFIVGGVEAPLTGFTIAQMKALRIYTNDEYARYPCRPYSSESPRRNTMVLGEGAALFTLEILTQEEIEAKKNVLGIIDGFGYGQESPVTLTSITENGDALRKSMEMSIRNMSTPSPIDLIISHAPGTIKGDKSELNAIKSLFGTNLPIIISNKWIIGHTFAASGAFSLEYALHILAHDTYIDFPYPVVFSNSRKSISKIMINTAGFGGNAASLIVTRVE